MKDVIRMCVCCRNRFEQQELIRLQYLNGKLQRYTNAGRSFYLCCDCLKNKDSKKLLNSLLNTCKTNKRDQILLDLKEIYLDS